MMNSFQFSVFSFQSPFQGGKGMKTVLCCSSSFPNEEGTINNIPLVRKRAKAEQTCSSSFPNEEETNKNITYLN